MVPPRSGTHLAPGDVLEVRDSDVTWHLCYVGRHERLGDTVWVLPEPRDVEGAIDCEAFNGDGYYAFYPATAAARKKLVRKAGFCPQGMRVVPRLLRFSATLFDAGPSITWRIAESASIGAPFVIREGLSAEEARLPVAEIWNHEYLLEQLRAGWHPRREATESSPDAG